MALGRRPLAAAPLAAGIAVAGGVGSVAFAGSGAFAPVGVASGVFQYLRPIADIASNGWLPLTGSDLFAMVDEASVNHADYDYSPTNPTTQMMEQRLAPGYDGFISGGHTLRMGLKANGLDTNFDLALVQGSTVLDSWTENVTVGAGPIVRSRTFAGAVADAITDYTDLRIRVVARA